MVGRHLRETIYYSSQFGGFYRLPWKGRHCDEWFHGIRNEQLRSSHLDEQKVENKKGQEVGPGYKTPRSDMAVMSFLQEGPTS